MVAWPVHDPVDAVQVDGDRIVPAASTIKVPVLVAALLEVEAGRLDLAQPVGVETERTAGSGVLAVLPGVTTLTLADLLRLMIVVSDNTATNAALTLLGHDLVTAVARDCGLTATVVRRRMMDAAARRAGRENTTSARDQAHLLQRLVSGELLGGDLGGFALAALGAQQFADGLPSLLPEEVRVAHKTGELPDVRHDVGVLTGPDGRQAVVAALVSDLDRPRASHAASTCLAEVGEATWLALSVLPGPA